MSFPRALAAVTAALVLMTATTGCGAARLGTPAVAGMAGVQWVGSGPSPLTEPALARLSDGTVLLVGTTDAVGDRHLRAATSMDGRRFGALAPVEDGAAYTDQSPAIVSRPEGGADLYFVSNRSGADFELYHAAFAGGAFEAPEKVEGFTGAQSVAAARAGDRVGLAVEVLGEGLFFAEAAAPAKKTALADAGFEPTIASVAGSFGVVYQRAGVLYGRREGAAGFGAEREIAKGEGRLRLPAFAWGAGEGELAYGERTAAGYALRAVRLDEDLAPVGTKKVPSIQGEARKIALLLDDNQNTGVLAWAHQGATGPQGVAIATY